MKPKIKIPRGWRKLNPEEIIQHGDKYYDEGMWDDVKYSIGYTVKEAELIAIRRKKGAKG